jgi:hypothetical protein
MLQAISPEMACFSQRVQIQIISCQRPIPTIASIIKGSHLLLRGSRTTGQSLLLFLRRPRRRVFGSPNSITPNSIGRGISKGTRLVGLIHIGTDRDECSF